MNPHSPSEAPRLIWRLVEESLSESAYLWTRLDGALDASNHTLSDVERWVQERLSGALDGVRIAGEASITPLLTAALEDSDPGLISVAVHLLAILRTPRAIRTLEDYLRAVPPQHLPAVVAGLGRAGEVELLHWLLARLPEHDLASAALIEALTFCASGVDLDWKAALTAEVTPLRHAAASGMRFLAEQSRADVMWVALQSDDPETRARAIEAGVLAGDGGAWSRCVDALRHSVTTTRPLLCLTSALGSATEHAAVINALSSPSTAADALWALGFAGTREAVDACVAQLDQPDAAQAALDTIRWITATAFALPRSTGDDDPDAPAKLDNDGAANMVDDITSWWSRERERYAPGRRYQQGQPVTYARLREALESGPTHRRHAIAAELSARSRGQLQLQTLAFCPIQRRQLATLVARDARELRDQARYHGFPALEDAACFS